MIEAQPSSADQEILAALSARDDAGSWNYWVLYRSFRMPILIVYYVILVIIVAWLTLRRARNSNVRTHLNSSTPS